MGISKSSTVASVIEEALILFDMEVGLLFLVSVISALPLNMQDEVADNFLLDQVCLYSGVSTISLAPSHCIWDSITFLKTVSYKNNFMCCVLVVLWLYKECVHVCMYVCLNCKSTG